MRQADRQPRAGNYRLPLLPRHLIRTLGLAQPWTRIRAVVGYFVFVLSFGAFAAEPMVDENYSRVHKWDFTGVNAHCISFDFDDGGFDVERLSTRRLSGEYSALIDNSVKREGPNSAQFELRPGDRVSGGWRAELRDLNNAKPVTSANRNV